MKFKNWAESKERDLGASLVEFALLVALLALVAIPAIRPIATANNNNICKVVVEGLLIDDGAQAPGDGTCWYQNEYSELVQVF